MFRPNWKSLLIGVVVAATLATGASQADAGWYGYYHSAYWGSYYTPCYSPCYTVSCDPCYSGPYLGYRPGPIRQLLFGPYRWYYGGWSCWSPSYYQVCFTEDATSAAVEGSVPTRATKPETGPTATEPTLPPITEPTLPGPLDSGLPATSVPGLDVEPDIGPGAVPGTGPIAEPPTPGPLDTPPGAIPGTAIPGTAIPGATPAPGPGPAPMPGTGTGPAREGSATLTLHLPADTKVFINGRETLSTGNERQYVSHGLQPGLEYKYEIRAEVTCVRKVGPQVAERLKIPLFRTVFLTAGESQHVAFTSDVVTIPNEITGEDQVLVIDDELKRIQGQLAASKRTKSGPRPPSWGP